MCFSYSITLPLHGKMKIALNNSIFPLARLSLVIFYFFKFQPNTKCIDLNICGDMLLSLIRLAQVQWMALNYGRRGTFSIISILWIIGISEILCLINIKTDYYIKYKKYITLQTGIHATSLNDHLKLFVIHRRANVFSKIT